MTKEKILAYAKQQGYDGIEPLGKWRQYDCYEPTFKNATEQNPAIVGMSLIILVDGTNIRMSTVEEAFQQIREIEEIDDD